MHRYVVLLCSSSTLKWVSWCVGVTMVALTLTGCSKEESIAASPPKRAVKVEAVKEATSSDVRFTGTVRPRQQADLAFEFGGQLLGLSVDVGDAVKAGQVLATLDLRPARLRLQQAQARMDSSRARAVERKSNAVRQQHLLAAGSVAQSVAELADAGLEQARSEQKRAQADLALARREVERGQLIAPFSGRVVSRRASRYAELTPGQAVIELESLSDQQVVAALPVAQAEGLKPGDTALAYRVESPDIQLELVLEGISPRAENGLLRTCIFRLDKWPATLPSGLIVLVQMKTNGPRHRSIPEKALWVGSDSPYVFVYQPTQEKVEMRRVSVIGVEAGRALIDSGVAVDEQVVTAGASFITDGQSVNVFQSTTRLTRN